MRLIRLLPAALLLFGAAASPARDWIEYVSRADRFSLNFPGQPKVQESTWMSEYGATFPARVHSYSDGPNRYSMTVVDYSGAEKFHTERAERCKANGGDGDACQNDWRPEMRGAIVYASWKFLQRDAKVTHYSWYFLDLIEGHRLQLTNADKSRTFAAIHMYENHLYILEATVAPGQPPPGLFQQSLAFLDKEGTHVRYTWRGIELYSNGFPPPPRAR